MRGNVTRTRPLLRYALPLWSGAACDDSQGVFGEVVGSANSQPARNTLVSIGQFASLSGIFFARQAPARDGHLQVALRVDGRFHPFPMPHLLGGHAAFFVRNGTLSFVLIHQPPALVSRGMHLLITKTLRGAAIIFCFATNGRSSCPPLSRSP